MFQGSIDDVAFFGVALTAAQLAQTLESGAMAVLAPAEAGDLRLNFESNIYYDAVPMGSPASFELRPLVETRSYLEQPGNGRIDWQGDWRGFAKAASQPNLTDFRLSFVPRR